MYKLLCSGVSQRRAARLLGVTQTTVARKFRFLAGLAKGDHLEFLESLRKNPVQSVQFDDVESSEHSKCKPLSISLAVNGGTREILGVEVSEIPSKGPLAKISRKKYGPRRDGRPKALNDLFLGLKPFVDPVARFTSDQSPLYRAPLQRHFPLAPHVAVKSRRGCVAGQGELKKIGFDPLFSLNHTAAMLRANINRLFRRTWCTTKKKERLLDHLYLYARFHNRDLVRARTLGGEAHASRAV